MIKSPRFLLALGALVAGIAGAMALFATAPETPTARPKPAIPLVRTIAAETSSVQLRRSITKSRHSPSGARSQRPR